MKALESVRIAPLPLDRFATLVGEAEMRRVRGAAASAREALAGRVLWNVNSTAVGGGVAEMLRPLLAYTRGAGIDTRWVVIHGVPEFFRVTKRLHHALHGSPGDGSALGPEERAIYESTLHAASIELAAVVRSRDVVLLHDPQTAGLAPALLRAGARVIWRCHIGHDAPGREVELGWAFLAPYLKEVPAFVFSREAYVPAVCDAGRSRIIAPSIDPFSAKNQSLDENSVRGILTHAGLVEGPAPPGGGCVFTREDGSPGRVERQAEIVRLGRAPAWETPLVVQVSRWDPLKDPVGVLHGFAALGDGVAPGGAQLVLAGPDVKGVRDDPEGAQVLREVEAAWRALPEAVRARVQLVSLPTADVEENAAIVNALQRHAAVIVQKSLHEGFGLTVTEGMWKGRPVLASAVGGICDQIEDGVHGLLLDDPADTRGFAALLGRLLGDEDLAARLGRAARQRVVERFLGLRHLIQYAELIARLDAESHAA